MKMLVWVDARRVALLVLCLVACTEVSARKVDQIRLPSHTRVKYMPADHKKVTSEEEKVIFLTLTTGIMVQYVRFYL